METLEQFITEVSSAPPRRLAGVYVPEIMACGVVEQPAGNPFWISPYANILTLFGTAAQSGSIGLLAHNYRAGQYFIDMGIGQAVYLIYGHNSNGRVVHVKSISKYQALRPNNPNSPMSDLVTHQVYGASHVYSIMYGVQNAVVFQTCITQNNNPTWGRLFVVCQ